MSKRRGKGTRLGQFTPLLHAFFLTPQYANLSPRAVKLLIDVYLQYRGSNNGDLCASWSVMRESGWTSKDQLAKALAELEGANWLLRTRQGSINKASLYAVTFLGVDRCGGKLDVQADPKPSHAWRTPAAPKPASSRRVRPALRPARCTGTASPHSGSIARLVPYHLPRDAGRTAA